MEFYDHSKLKGMHAFLGASKSSWTNYDDEKFDRVYTNMLAAARGTELHALAFDLIRLGVKLPRSPKTLNMYVNDVISFRMVPEQVLFYSENAFGTADAIKFVKNRLMIFDLKTGITPAHMRQLEIYVAFFCLEYRVNPREIEIELRIYQNDDIEFLAPDPEDILKIMDLIINFDKRINVIREKVL